MQCKLSRVVRFLGPQHHRLWLKAAKIRWQRCSPPSEFCAKDPFTRLLYQHCARVYLWNAAQRSHHNFPDACFGVRTRAGWGHNVESRPMAQAPHSNVFV
uniref:Uncharacterized protein n=1 Tax=Eutreptiella gymnastica TaxID=73025 RepID=A0A7S4GE54_9EUGL